MNLSSYKIKTKEFFSVIFLAYMLILIFQDNTIHAKDNQMDLYDFNVTTISGEDISMSKYKGQVLLVVNVASNCGFTSQYEGLEKLYQTYKDNGFMVLGFPCDQFGGQEPDDNEKIRFFCHENYDVNFDMFSKTEVNGESALPLYKYLKEKEKGVLWTSAVKWNFTKFLVDREGNVIKRYGSSTKPEKIKEDIEDLL